jgi:hypothetical protein
MSERSRRALAVRAEPATPADLKALGFKKGELSPARLRELGEIVSLAREVCGERLKDWFLSPEPRLGNVLPATLLRDPANGPNLVKQALYNSLRGRIPS